MATVRDHRRLNLATKPLAALGHLVDHPELPDREPRLLDVYRNLLTALCGSPADVEELERQLLGELEAADIRRRAILEDSR